jgi:DNA-binding SARP family transcriptional activator/predicted ATPase/Tfp pilus assembly protein PilF
MEKREANVLQLSLLGAPKLLCNGKVISGFITRKAEALFYYLAVTERPHTRAALAALLWPEMSEQNARKNLRDVIASLRKLVGDHLLISNQTLALDLAQPYWVDVTALSQVLTDPKNVALEDLREALGLYHGEFLEGFSILHATSFDEWARQKREEYHTLVLNGLHLLADRYLTTGEYDPGLTATRRLLLLDPWNEEAHRKQMMLLALSGQRSAALAQYQTCVQILADEFRAEPMPETTTLYRRIRDGETLEVLLDLPAQAEVRRRSGVRATDATEGVNTTPALPHNLPRQLTPLVGRLHESSVIHNKILDPAYPLVTIVGEGGVGKTRLALRVAQAIVEGLPPNRTDEGVRRGGRGAQQPFHAAGNGGRPVLFVDGVWFVPLAGLSAGSNVAEQIAEAIADILDLDLAGEAQLKAQLFARIAGKQILLILDNFEQLGAGVGFLVELLQSCYHVKVLVTSRHRLNLQAEFVYRLEGLTAPDPVDDSDWANQSLLHFDSIQLFLERAGRTSAGFVLTAENQRHVLAICQFVEGLPLGIELAAALVEHHDVAVIAQHLTNNYTFLAADLADLAPRHRSMSRVLDYSWQLLTTEEAQVLAQCSVFRDGFTLEAATAITGATLLQLESLIRQSLLRYADEERFALHELVQRFAAEQLDRTPAQKRLVMNRFYEYYLNLLHTNQSLLPEQQHVAAALRLEFDNVRSAWLLAVAANDVTALAKGLDGLMLCCELMGRYKTGETLFRHARQWCEEQRTLGEVEQPAIYHLLARLCLAQGYLSFKLGNLGDAAVSFERALEEGRRRQDRLLLAEGHFRVMALWLARGNYRAALAVGEDALQQVRAGESSTLEGNILTNMAVAYGRLGAHKAAHDLFMQALQLAQRRSAREAEATVLLHWGELYEQTGNFAKALDCLQQALFLLRRLDNQSGIAMVLYRLGSLLLSVSILDEARSYLEQALVILHSVSDRFYEEAVLTKLCSLFFRLGLYEKAEFYQEQALRLSTDAGHQAILAEALLYAGRLWAVRGQKRQAANAFQQALAFWQESGQRGWYAAAQMEVAWLAFEQGDRTGALSAIDLVSVELAHTPFDFATEPLLMLWRCYLILTANQDARAPQLLITAYQQLQQQAATISDDKLRQNFLAQVAHHQAIIQEFQTQKR